MEQYYPFNYFRTIVSPVLCFKNRDYLSSFQQLMIILFLIALLLIPISFQQFTFNSVSLVDYVPSAVHLIDDNLVTHLNQLNETQGELLVEENQIVVDNEAELVAIITRDDNLEEYIGSRNAVIFTSDYFLLKEANRPAIVQPYMADSTLTRSTSVAELLNEMSRQWFQANQSSIRLTNIINISLLTFTSFMILLLGASFFLSLMRTNNAYDIKSFKEAFTIVLNCYGLPTIIAMVVGFVYDNVTHMLTVHGIAFVLILIRSYWMTHFNDQYVREKAKPSKKI